jgi:hypothetical protein
VDLINRSITPNGQMSMFWAPLSQAIVFGLSFATLLTLIATPAMLAVPAYLREVLGRFKLISGKFWEGLRHVIKVIKGSDSLIGVDRQIKESDPLMANMLHPPAVITPKNPNRL